VEAADFYSQYLEFEVLLQDHANKWPRSLREAVAELRPPEETTETTKLGKSA